MSSGTESIGWRENMSYFRSRHQLGRNRNSMRSKNNSFAGGRFPLDVIIEGDTGITQQHQRQQDKEAVALFNAKIRDWGGKVNAVLRLSVKELIDTDKKLSKSIKQNYRHYGKQPAEGQEITSIGFSFKEEGVFVHLGVGRGYNMEGGTRIITKKDNDEWKREPKPWFNPVIERLIPELVEIVSEYCSKLTVNATRLYINT